MKKALSLALCVLISISALHGFPATATDLEQEPITRYTLVDSTIDTNQPSNISSFNCYAFAINKTTLPYQPGYFSRNHHGITQSELQNNDSDYIAELVKNDLQTEELNKKCVVITTTKPTSVASGQTAICVRKGYCSSENRYDYHFMKKVGNVWKHKPGSSSILILQKAINSQYWTNEGCYGGVNTAPNTIYTGTIQYILFKSDHNYDVSYTGINYHEGNRHFYKYKKTCTLCGDIKYYYTKIACSGPPCVQPSAVGDEAE